MPDEGSEDASDVSDGDAANDDGAALLRRWFTERGAEGLVHLRGLHRGAWSIDAVLGGEREAFREKLRLALQPAPELRVISHHVITKIQSHLHHGQQSRQPRQQPPPTSAERHHRSKGGGKARGRKLLGGGGGGFSLGGGGVAMRAPEFNCLHVSAAELSSTNRLKAVAATLPAHVPTLLVREVGEAADGGSDMRAALPLAAKRVFRTPLQVGDFYPYWDEVAVRDATQAHTLAYDLIQQLVCAAARRVHGNAGSEFVHGVCHWRRSPVVSKLIGRRLAAVDDVCSTLWEGGG